MINKNKMKIAAKTATGILLGLSISFCGGGDGSGSANGDDVYINQNLPADYRVETPDTLNTNQSVSGTLQKPKGRHRNAAAGGGGDSCFDVGGDGSSFGYFQVKSTICQLNDSSQQLQFELLLIDASLDKIKDYLSEHPGASFVPANTYEITFTRAMRELLKSAYSSWLPPGEIDLFLPDEGTKMPNPPITYRQENKDDFHHIVEYVEFANIVEGGYDEEIIIEDCPECDVDYCLDFPDDPFCTGEFDDPPLKPGNVRADSNGPEFNSRVRWNNAKTLIRVTDEFEFDYGDGASDVGSTYFQFDAEEEVMTYRDNFTYSFDDGFCVSKGEFNYAVDLKQCEPVDKKCVEFTLKFEGSDEFECEGDPGPSGFSFNENSFGKADNDGGFIQSDSIFSDPFIGTEKFTYREEFDGDGNLLSQCYDDGFGNFIVVDGFAGTGGCDFEDNEYFDSIFAGGDEPIFDFGGPAIIITGPGIESFTGDLVILPPGVTPGNIEDEVGFAFFYEPGVGQADYWGPEQYLNNPGQLEVYQLGFNESTGEETFTATNFKVALE